MSSASSSNTSSRAFDPFLVVRQTLATSRKTLTNLVIWNIRAVSNDPSPIIRHVKQKRHSIMFDPPELTIQLPEGIVTLMFTDIVNSTKLKHLMEGDTAARRDAKFRSEIKETHDEI